MRGSMTVFWGLMIPLVGTTLGSACVFFLKDKGYRVISGKVPTKYFEEKFYGMAVG